MKRRTNNKHNEKQSNIKKKKETHRNIEKIHMEKQNKVLVYVRRGGLPPPPCNRPSGGAPPPPEPPHGLTRLIIMHPEAFNEFTGGPGGPGAGFCGPRVIIEVRSGKPLRLLRVQNHTQDLKKKYRDHQDHPCTRY